MSICPSSSNPMASKGRRNRLTARRTFIVQVRKLDWYVIVEAKALRQQVFLLQVRSYTAVSSSRSSCTVLPSLPLGILERGKTNQCKQVQACEIRTKDFLAKPPPVCTVGTQARCSKIKNKFDIWRPSPDPPSILTASFARLDQIVCSIQERCVTPCFQFSIGMPDI